MAVPTSPDEWLPVLAKRLDDRFVDRSLSDGYPGLVRLRKYAHGKPDLPEMGANLRASWEKFQRKARRDYGGVLVGSLADRCVWNGIRIGTAQDSPALEAARRILRDNRADLQIAQAVRDMLETRWGYLAVGDDGGRAVMTRELPEQFIVAPDPLRPWKARAALKVWRDADAGMDYALVWASGVRQPYARQAVLDGVLLRRVWVDGGWSRAGEPEVFEGDPPVVVLTRPEHTDDLSTSVGGAVLEPHMDLIDAIVLGKLNRLVITAMQAFRQRALKTAPNSPGLPEKDLDGKPIDYEKEFSPAPGALWELPEGIDIWESQLADIPGLIQGEVQDAKDFAVQTGVPVSMLIPDGANQTAEGASTAKERQIAQARAITRAISPALSVAVVYMLRVEGVDLGGDTVETLWVPPEHVSLTEKYSAAAQAKAAGRSRRGIMRDILGMSPDQIAEEERDLAAEQLEAALAFTPTTPAPAQPQQVTANGPANA